MKRYFKKIPSKEEDSPLRSLLSRYRGLALVALVGIISSSALFTIAKNADRSRISLDFHNDAEKRMGMLKRELTINLHEIDDLKTYYKSSERVTRSEFATYALGATSQYPGVVSEMWVPRVPAAKRTFFEKETRKIGARDFQITERGEQSRLERAGNREEYFPIHFIEPYVGNEIFAGFDLSSEPEILKILNRARDTGSVSISRQIDLGQAGVGHLDYLVIYPFYEKGTLLQTAEGRREALEGFLVGTLNLEQIVRSAMSYLEEEKIDVYLFEGPSAPANSPLYHYLEGIAQTGTDIAFSLEEAKKEGLHHEEAINLAGQNFLFVLAPTKEYIAARKTWLPYGILAAGILGTFLLCSYIFAILRHNIRINQFAQNLLETRDALTRERDRAQRYLDIAGTIIVALNGKGEVTLINRKGSKMLGYSDADLIGQNWFRKCLPAKAREEVSAIFREAIEGEIEFPANFEYPVLTKSGEERVISWSSTFLNDDAGNIIGKLSSGEDVTDRKQATEALLESEKRFRDLVENSLTGILIIQEGRIVYNNPEQTRLFGDFLLPVKLSDLEVIHPDDREGFQTMLKRIESGTQKAVEGEYRYFYKAKSGKRRDLRWVYCRASVIEFRGKEATLVNFMDITRARELEMVIKDKMTSLGRVAAGIAHEIRNPLSGINIYTTTLKRIIAGSEEHRASSDIIEQIQSASDKIESVVRRALDFSKPGEARFALIDLNALVDESLNLSSVSLRKSGIEIEKEFERDLPPCYADERLFEQVIVNLISNAAEALTETERPRKIKVATSLENNTILLRVADSGPGVPENLRDQIFDPFFTTKSENTGLGLSISNRIVVDHGGQMDITKSEWGGAEFVLKIPRERRKKPR